MPGLASRCRCRSTGQARHMQRLDVSEASSAGSWRKLMQKKDTLPVHKRNILLLTVDLLLESTWKPSGLCMPHTSFRPYGCGWRNSTPKPPLLHHAPCFAGNFLHQLVVPRPTHCSVLLERVCIPTGGRGEGPGNADKYTPFENLQKPYQSCKTYITTLEPFQKKTLNHRP